MQLPVKIMVRVSPDLEPARAILEREGRLAALGAVWNPGSGGLAVTVVITVDPRQGVGTLDVSLSVEPEAFSSAEPALWLSDGWLSGQVCAGLRQAGVTATWGPPALVVAGNEERAWRGFREGSRLRDHRRVA